VWAVECEGGTLSATGDRADRRKESVEPGAWVQTGRVRRTSIVGYGCVCVCVCVCMRVCVVCTTVRQEEEVEG
jgi:hypothetical protein